jgi:hypothetical protein
VFGLVRNHRSVSVGISVRFAPESMFGFGRNAQFIESAAETDVARRIRKILNVLIGIAAIFCFLLWRIPVFARDLYVPRSVHDFGTVKRGTEVTANFTVVNTHLQPVTIIDVRGGCGCNSPVIGKKLPYRLRPFESIVVGGTVDTETKSGPTSIAMQVVAADGKSVASLTIRGNVNP